MDNTIREQIAVHATLFPGGFKTYLATVAFAVDTV
jgi:hypothetical protein